MNPSLASFIESFEEEARKAGRYRLKIGHEEFIFLKRVAQYWMRRFAQQGWFEGIGSEARRSTYKLTEGGKS